MPQVQWSESASWSRTLVIGWMRPSEAEPDLHDEDVQVVDAGGGTIVPGIVDAGTRAPPFAPRRAGSA
jgi:imidazolonepropionase-like amidohydrolase